MSTVSIGLRMPDCAMEGGLAVVGYEGLNMEGQSCQVLFWGEQLGNPAPVWMGDSGGQGSLLGRKSFLKQLRNRITIG